ncbi:Porin OmpF [Serratia marcescens]|uniref:Porin OmpF n=1 Tax=Serratia marcescens TaxID=615 RepID=A0A380A4R6_SERMA|nr:Porin OmpF [Serratia marcescens]
MMKRNILAVVIPALLAAGAANAAEIYNKDGNKLDLYGKVDVCTTSPKTKVMTAIRPMFVSASKVKLRLLTN